MRRSPAVGIALAAITCLSPLAALTGCAATQSRTYRREVPANGLIQQRRFDWCWAACCEMAYRASGRSDVTQEALVATYKGGSPAVVSGGVRGGEPSANLAADDEDDHRAQDFELVRALAVGTDVYLPIGVHPGRGVIFDQAGLAGYLHAWAGLYLASSIAVEDIARGQPVLAVLRDWEGAPGHVGFVIEIDARPDLVSNSVSGICRTALDVGKAVGIGGSDADSVVAYLPKEFPTRYLLDRITFYDPSFHNPGIKTIEGADVKRHLAYLLSPTMARAILAREREIVKLGAMPIVTGLRIE
jgi:hypothetical protein